jgi:cardiolipin synthase
MFLVIPCVIWLANHAYAATLMVFSVAALTDGLDGGLAKRFGWISRLGAILDPIADKILLNGVILTLGWQHDLAWWWVAGVLLRDLVIVGGALAYRIWVGYLEMQPSLISKLNTFLQLASVIVVIASHVYINWFTLSFVTTLLSVTFVTTVVSGYDYVVSTWQRAQVHRHYWVE